MTLHGIALGKSAISGSLFCAVFRTVTKHDITKSNANRACCHRSVEHDGWVNSRRQRRSRTGIRRFPGRYLIAGSVLFVSYEICLALSLGYAATRHQAIEVGMVNYLWPSLTILFAILFNGQKTNWLIVPGLLIALTGVCWVLGGENGLNPGEIISNVATSPLSYLLAFLGAFIWATYCTVTNKYARGFNGITVFVLLTAVALWLHYFLTPQPAMIFSLPVIAKLFTAALTLGFAYAAWNVGILHGNVTIMAVGSYFTPVMSSALAALLLSSPLSFSFWQGAVMVCVGSLLCWLATRRR